MIKLDIDGVAADAFDPIVFIDRARGMTERAGFNIIGWSWVPSPSGTGTHVRMTVAPEPTALETVALQAILGSDPYREAYNLGRVRMLDKVPVFWGTRWNVLYTATGRVRHAGPEASNKVG